MTLRSACLGCQQSRSSIKAREAHGFAGFIVLAAVARWVADDDRCATAPATVRWLRNYSVASSPRQVTCPGNETESGSSLPTSSFRLRRADPAPPCANSPIATTTVFQRSCS